MNKLLIIPLLLIVCLTSNSQVDRAKILEDLEKNDLSSQAGTKTATLKSATRLFGDTVDLTSVILIIPRGSKVSVLGSDGTFLNVIYNENEGYIYSRHAEIDKISADIPHLVSRSESVQEEQNQAPQPRQKTSRFSYLENKYGTDIASKLYTGKIWKGMTAEMVNDSWCSPLKINRVISGNNVREEWIYKNSWLFIENSILIEWGPVKR